MRYLNKIAQNKYFGVFRAPRRRLGGKLVPQGSAHGGARSHLLKHTENHTIMG